MKAATPAVTDPVPDQSGAVEEQDAAPAVVSDPAPATEQNPDAAFLQSMIDGDINLLDPELLGKIEPLFDKYADDTAMMELLNRAATAYGDAAVAAAKAALGA